MNFHGRNATAKGMTVEWNRGAENWLNSLGGSRTAELVAAGNALAKSIRQSIRGKSKDPSRPGEPPRSKTGKLRKSVKTGPVGAARRVGVLAFYASMLEFGIDTHSNRPAPQSRRSLFTGKLIQVSRGASERFRRKQSGRKASGKGHRVLQPRPFMQRALSAAADDMVGLYVSEAGRRAPTS